MEYSDSHWFFERFYARLATKLAKIANVTLLFYSLQNAIWVQKMQNLIYILWSQKLTEQLKKSKTYLKNVCLTDYCGIQMVHLRVRTFHFLKKKSLYPNVHILTEKRGHSSHSSFTIFRKFLEKIENTRGRLSRITFI